LDIVKITREGIRRGKSLDEIKKELPISKGKHPPSSEKYANDLVKSIGNNARASLADPLCAIFVKLNRWQIE
jgi:hypothetical protein